MVNQSNQSNERKQGNTQVVNAVTIEGTIDSIRFQNPENGWAAVLLEVDKELLAATGIMPGIRLGMSVSLTGSYDTNKYGQYFKVEKYQPARPKNTKGIYNYLSSGLIKNIGPVIARKIVDTFGTGTLEILEKQPERLREVHGIGKKRIESIIEAAKDTLATGRVMEWLMQYDIPTGLATKIYRAYGDDAIPVLETNPYKLYDDIKGVGFKRADDVAKRLGIPADSEFRILSGFRACLEDAATRGDTYIGEHDLVTAAASPDYLDLPETVVEPVLESFGFVDVAVNNDGLVSLHSYYYAEKKIAQRLVAINASGSHIPGYQPDFGRIEQETGFNYSHQQRLAIAQAMQNPVLVMTGGPGTGKTTTTNAIIRECEHNGLKVLLAAPTGRAAKRMTESSGREAKTIHRLLEYKQGEFTRNETNTLPADVIIIDEASMIDTLLMRDLLKAVADKTKLIIVGDTDQLPSVGAGCVLRDIIYSGLFRVVRLTEIYRQAQDSKIITNAHKINRGLVPVTDNADNGDIRNDFWFFTVEDRDRIGELIVDLVVNRIPKKFGITPDDIQVLSPMRRDFDPIGATQLNMNLQQAVNPDGQKAATRGRMEFRIGDRVMQTKNNYDKEVFNGDIGIVSDKLNPDAEEDSAVMVVNFDGYATRYTQGDLVELELAYACTIHKSQGSEYPVVIIPVHTSHYIMLKRNLIYTGITRAKKQCILIGNKKALAMAINTEDTQKRLTQLQERIQEENHNNQNHKLS